MKKRYKLAIVLLAVLLLASTLLGCSRSNMFGMFSQNGKFLRNLAVKEINYSQACELVNRKALARSYIVNQDVQAASDDNSVRPPSDNLVDSIKKKYSEIQITIKYYNHKRKKMKKTDYIMFDLFSNALKNNYIDTSIGLRVSNILMFEIILDDMEDANKKFSDENAYYTHPYSYHTDVKRNLVVRMHAYAEMSSLNMNGGIACNFRQDTEVQYDSENKIKKWQTSLGMWVASASETVSEGYIYEVEFKWIKKK